MLQIPENYIVDETGKRTGVILDMQTYEKIMMELEELESIRAYDAAKALNDEVIPFEEAVQQIERNR